MFENMLMQLQKNTTILLKISSVNKNSLKAFISTLNKVPVLNIKTKIKGLKVAKSLVSVLTSPHVNKVAQEQFNKENHSMSLLVECFDFNKFLFFLKKLVSQVSDVQIKVIILTKQRTRLPNKFFRSNWNPDKAFSNCRRSDTAGYLALLESYGEMEKVVKTKD